MDFFIRIFIIQGYPVYCLMPETSATDLTATKGFMNILKLVWNQTKPIFVPPYLDSTVKLCFMVFTLFGNEFFFVINWCLQFLIIIIN